MIDFEREFTASERMRERIQHAEHERMAQRARRARRQLSGPSRRARLAMAVGRPLAVVRRIAHLAEAA